MGEDYGNSETSLLYARKIVRFDTCYAIKAISATNNVLCRWVDNLRAVCPDFVQLAGAATWPMLREDGMAAGAADDLALEKATMRRVILRLVPFLMVCYFFTHA